MRLNYFFVVNQVKANRRRVQGRSSGTKPVPCSSTHTVAVPPQPPPPRPPPSLTDTHRPCQIMIVWKAFFAEFPSFRMANGMLKKQMNIDRHSPRLMPNNCQHFYPPNFSLPTTFKLSFSCYKLRQTSRNNLR
jgi:hypothetical protein